MPINAFPQRPIQPGPRGGGTLELSSGFTARPAAVAGAAGGPTGYGVDKAQVPLCRNLSGEASRSQGRRLTILYELKLVEFEGRS